MLVRTPVCSGQVGYTYTFSKLCEVLWIQAFNLCLFFRNYFFILTLDEHPERGPERAGGEGRVLGLAGQLLQVVPGAGPEPQGGGDGGALGQRPRLVTVLSQSCTAEICVARDMVGWLVWSADRSHWGNKWESGLHRAEG